MPTPLWDEMQSLLQEYVQLFQDNPEQPVTAPKVLYTRLMAFAERAEAENHPAAGEVMYLQGGRYITLRPLEAIRILLQLKQRRNDRDAGKALVERVQFALRPRSYPVRDVQSAKLKGALKEIATLGGFPSYSGFQTAAWEAILEAVAEASPVLLTAPTGAGKTEAFMLPLVHSALKDHHRFLIVYPRRELIKDQLTRLLKTVAVANDTVDTQADELIIGVQLGGIQHSLQDALTPSDNSMMRVRCTDCGEFLRKIARSDSWACGCKNKFLPPYHWNAKNWWFTVGTKSWDKRPNYRGPAPAYFEHLKTLVVEWPDVITCPVCDDGTSLQAPVTEFMTADSSADTARPVRFHCSNPRCTFSAPFSLSKEQHLKVAPHFLVTNVESLDKLLLDPRYEEAGYFQAIDGIALDETHVYHTLYGAHVHQLLKRLQTHKGSPCALIGLSATIPEPADFGERLFGRPVEHLVEANSSRFEQECLSAEYFLFLQVPDSDQISSLSTLLQTCMAMGHAVLPATPQPTSGSQVMVFSDSLDVILRAEIQLNDAERNGLYNLRMADKIGGAYECEGLDRDRCPTLTDGSMCPTYLKGECWRLFWDGDVREKPLDVTSVSAQLKNGMQAAREADVIISSPSLEVGVDLPAVGATVHYKTPRAVFSFIQRKGRAGRKQEQFPFTVAVLAGNDPMDVFHFQQFERLVAGEYRLPLNPENPIVEKIHQDYLDGMFSGPVMETYTALVNSPAHQRYPQNALRPTGWKVVRDQATCPRWLDDVKLALNPSVERGQGMELVTSDLARLLQQKLKRIEELAEIFGRQVEDRTSLTGDLEKALSELASQIPDPLRTQSKFTELWAETMARVNNINVEVSQAGSLEAIKDQVVALLNDLDDDLSRLRKWLNTQQGNTSQARACMLLVQGKANALLDAIGNQGLLSAHDQVSDLRYQVAALEKLHDAAKSKLKLPAEIVRRYQQAQFYLCWSCKHWATCHLPQKLHYFIPETYFDNPANLLVELDRRNHEEPGYMLYSTYVPWKIFYRFGSEPISVRAHSTYTNTAPDGTPQVAVKLEGLEGIWDVFDGQPYFLPRKIHTTRVNPIEIPQAGNRYRICPACYNLAVGAEAHCPSCHSQTIVASMYAAPMVQRRFVARERKDGLKRLSLCQIDGLTQVVGCDVSYRTQQMAQSATFRALYSQPLGYRYETRGLVFELGDVIEMAWKVFAAPDEEKNHRIRKVALLAREMWSGADAERDQFDTIILHTAAHMLLKAVSGMCGINEESLEYAWNDQGHVAVWEKFTGGAGISDLFMSYVKTQARDVYLALRRTVQCDHCAGTARDGCPDCVWISYCQAGRRDQPAAVSQTLGNLLLNCLLHRVEFSAGLTQSGLVEQGGPLVVEIDPDGESAMCLDL